jgi:hypothetical protein
MLVVCSAGTAGCAILTFYGGFNWTGVMLTLVFAMNACMNADGLRHGHY